MTLFTIINRYCNRNCFIHVRWNQYGNRSGGRRRSVSWSLTSYSSSFSSSSTSPPPPPPLDTPGASSSSSSPPKRQRPKRQRFRRQTHRNMDDVPSLQDFLHKQSVLKLFRDFLRTISGLRDAEDIQKQIKYEFATMRHEQDNWNKKRALKEGQRRLKDLQTTVNTSFTSATRTKTNNKNEQSSINNQPQVEAAAAAADDDDGPKVGSGWPWERKDY